MRLFAAPSFDTSCSAPSASSKVHNMILTTKLNTHLVNAGRKHTPSLNPLLKLSRTAKMTKASGPSRTKIFPVSSLPDKLLLLIFRALVDDMYCANDEVRLDCFTLTNVCRSWRSLVLSTPQFWTRLHMVMKPRALSSARLQANVERSMNALVDVVIYLPCPPNSQICITPSPAFPRTKACLEVLRNCSHKWRSLRIIKEESDYTELFNLVLSKLSLSQAPVLHEIEITCPSNVWVTFVEESFQLLSSTHTPSLRKLTLEGCALGILPQHFDASSLTHLSLNFLRGFGCVQNSHATSRQVFCSPFVAVSRDIQRFIDTRRFTHNLQHVLDALPSGGQRSKADDSAIQNTHVAFRNILLSTRNLVSLEVHHWLFQLEHAETSSELDPVVLPVLCTLCIFMDTEKPAYLSGILGIIAAPNLVHLALYGNSVAWEESNLLDFSSSAFFLSQDQTPRFPSVRKLTMKSLLQSMHGAGKNIRSLFAVFPHVTDVVLDHDIGEVADNLVLESYDQNTPPPWPYLRQLTIEMPSMTKFHYIQQLLEWLRLRRASKMSQPAVDIRYERQGPGVNDARDLTVIRRVVNDATGYRASYTRDVVKQLNKIGALVDLRVTEEQLPCRKAYVGQSGMLYRSHDCTSFHIGERLVTSS